MEGDNAMSEEMKEEINTEGNTGEADVAVQETEQMENTQVDSGIEEEQKEVEEEKQKKPLAKRILSGAVELLIYVMIALFCIVVIPRYVVQRTEVSGPSMMNTLINKDNILVEKMSYRFGKPERFDIIVFYHFFDENNRDKNDEECYDFYVKRIIGLPGETVQIVGETILINGKPLKENYGKDPITYQGVAAEPFTLGEDEYFVLGDNREVSQDSRYEDVGNINIDDIVGRAWLRVYPLKKIGFLGK